MRWADKINGDVGSLLTYFLGPVGALVFLYGFVVDTLLARLLLIGLGAVLVALASGLLEIFFPKLFKTSSELNDEFNKRRRFGKKPSDTKEHGEGSS